MVSVDLAARLGRLYIPGWARRICRGCGRRRSHDAQGL